MEAEECCRNTSGATCREHAGVPLGDRELARPAIRGGGTPVQELKHCGDSNGGDDC